MSTLITGGTGFIGAEIVRMLLERGDGPIHVAHRSGNLGRLSGVEDQVTLHQFDLSDLDSVDAVIDKVKPTQLIHFGAILTGPGENDPQALLDANATGFIRIIEAARLAGTEQMLFASSIGTYGRDLEAGPINDRSLQRPNSVYGVTKVFAENLGAYYRGKYGLDFRSLRYPSIVGPGVTTWSLAQYTSWMIEKPALGEPFEVWTAPDAVIPIMYYKDAARAAVELADAPIEQIEGINYLVDGPNPTPNAGQIADAVRERIPGADLTFTPSGPGGQVRELRIDDSYARDEWGWEPAYGVGAMIDDLITEVARPT
ncbi:MAG: NAD-dependent epimerase/dehydratase family protein [Acidimicrobiales bacterium]|jgi:threonine 3-dehydrogenase